MTIRIERRVASRAGRRTDPEPPAAVADVPSGGWNWLGLGAACLALVGLTAWMIPAAAEVPQSRVALNLQGAGNTLQVQWRENTAGFVGALQSAALVVGQGQKEEIFDLMDQYGPEGQLAVPIRAQEVVVSLRVRREGQAAMTRTVTYVSPGPIHAMRNGAETEWLRWRNRELEEKVAALQARF
jgi:protein-L-isoaspartate O-methyltransferase